MPVNIESYQRFDAETLPVWSFVQLRNLGTTGETVKGDVILLGADGGLVAEVRGITLKRASQETALRPGKGQLEDSLYTVEWKCVPRLASQTDSAMSGGVWLQQDAKKLETVLTRLHDQYGLSEYNSEVLPQLDRLSREIILTAFGKLGWEPKLGESFTSVEFGRKINILPQYELLLGRLLEILQEDQISEKRRERYGKSAAFQRKMTNRQLCQR